MLRELRGKLGGGSALEIAQNGKGRGGKANKRTHRVGVLSMEEMLKANA